MALTDEIPFKITGATGTAELVAAVTGKRILLTSLFVQMTGTGTITFKSATTALSGAMPGGEPGFALTTKENGHVRTAAGQALNWVLGAGITVAEGFGSYRIY